MHIARRYSPPPPDPYPLPSLRLVILCVSIAVALSMVVVILLIDVRPPPLSDVFLTASYFPLGQSLALKSRRWTKSEKTCLNYGIPRLHSNYSDTLCGQALWQSSAESEEGDRYVNKIETVYRFFSSDNISSQYFHRYISGGAQLLLPLDHYVDETNTAPRAGEEFRAFKWDPLLFTPINKESTASEDALDPNKMTPDARQGYEGTPKACTSKECGSVFRHIVYVFRLVFIFYSSFAW